MQDGLRLSQGAREVWQEVEKKRGQVFKAMGVGGRFKVIRGTLQDKLVHGLGASHVRETSLTLHPLYGVPYIPGTSVKGTVRNWVLQAFFQGEEERVEKDTYSVNGLSVAAVFNDIFGSTGQKGLVEFYDAFVDKDFALRADVLTVHFQDYYGGGGRAPTDDLAPNPVAFLVVKARSLDFPFSLLKPALRRVQSGLGPQELVALVTTWLCRALQEQGIGSKTSAGYGFFESFRDLTAKEPVQLGEVSPGEVDLPKGGGARGRGMPPPPVTPPGPGPDLDTIPGLTGAIQALGQDQASLSRSRGEVFQRVTKAGREGELGPARALKAYWEKAGAWTDKKKKQLNKVNKIKELLGEK